MRRTFFCLLNRFYICRTLICCTFVFMKWMLMILGSVSLGLGILGIILPILPTTPFLLLAAALYFRSSPRLYAWLLSRPRLGRYILQFREHRAMPLRAKLVSVALVWITLLYCAFGGVVSTWWARIFFILLAIAISWHILSYKTLSK